MSDVGQPIETTTVFTDARLRRDDERQSQRLVAELVEQAAATDARITELEARLMAIDAKRQSSKWKA